MSLIQNQLLTFEELYQWLLDSDNSSQMTQRLLIIKQRLGQDQFINFSSHISKNYIEF